MKVFVLLSRIPYPLEKGDKLRAWHHLQEISKSHDVYLACLSDTKPHPDALEKLKTICKDVQFYRLNKIGIAWRLFSGFFSRKPFQVKYFYSYWVNKKLQSYIQEVQPNHIFAQLIRVSEYVKNNHTIPKTLDYMDAFSKGMERRMNISSGIKKWFFKVEAKRLLEYENLIFDYFENKTIISEQDRQLIYHPDQKKIIIVSNGVDTDFFTPKSAVKNNKLLFNGNMSYAPNVDCALYVAHSILPRLKEKNIKVNLLISGANPLPIIKNLSNENIKVSGWMDDIRDAYNSSEIFIAPMKIGTGLQNKLLEAMSMGLPCITTDLANNALKAKPREEILIGNTDEEIIQAIEQLINNQELYNRISEQGRQFVLNNYNWTTVSEPLLKLFISS